MTIPTQDNETARTLRHTDAAPKLGPKGLFDSRPDFHVFCESGEAFGVDAMRAQQGTFFILWDRAYQKGAQEALSKRSSTSQAVAWEIVDRNGEPVLYSSPTRVNPAEDTAAAAEDLAECDRHYPPGSPHRFAALYRDQPPSEAFQR